jgi:hypothetical protein
MSRFTGRLLLTPERTGFAAGAAQSEDSDEVFFMADADLAAHQLDSEKKLSRTIRSRPHRAQQAGDEHHDAQIRSQSTSFPGGEGDREDDDDEMAALARLQLFPPHLVLDLERDVFLRDRVAVVQSGGFEGVAVYRALHAGPGAVTSQRYAVSAQE